MNKSYLTQSIISLKAKYGYMLISNIILLISVFILSFFVMQKETQLILVNRQNIEERLHLNSKGEFQEDYLVDWAYSILKNLYNVSYANAENEVKNFLKIADLHSNDLEERLLTSAKILKKSKLSISFYPKNYELDKENKSIYVSGLHITHYGCNKKSINGQKTFKIDWGHGINSVIIVKNLTEVRSK